ncbi:MAG: TolC family protein [Acidobacteria bacterium]|nr:TolC family protein [Acidobacteriota bacterium]MBI3424539.1 TolC family protein [Acidobacteriota bacterium]
MKRFGVHCNALAFGMGVLLAGILLQARGQAQTPAPPPAPASSIPRKLNLADAENLLVQRNLAVLAAKYQIEAGRAGRLLAGYKPNPVLTVGLEQVPFYSPLAGSFPRFFKTNSDAGANPVYTVRLDKVWERGSKRELRLAQADAQLKANEAQMLDAMRVQLYQLRQAFTQAALARENLRLAESTQQQYEQTERLTVAKVELGDLAGVQVYRIRAGLLQYQQAVVQARTAYEQATRDVLNVLGARVEEIEPLPSDQVTGQRAGLTTEPPPAQPNAGPGEAVTLTASLTGVGTNAGAGLSAAGKVSANAIEPEAQVIEALRAAPLEISYQFDDRPLPQTLPELRRLALEARPDVLAARRLAEAAGSNLALAQAQRTRDVAFGWEYQRAGSDHSLGVVMSVPLFVYNNQRAGITQAEAQQKSAEAQLKQAETQAVTDVEKAYQAYLSAHRILELYSTQNLAQVAKLRDITDYTFKQGALTLFELLDAQRYYNQTLTSYNQARADYQLALWQLEQAIGKPLR